MYYKGTQQECISYDDFVTANEKYLKGGNWANPTRNRREIVIF
jgi:hypothetical protein